ncbi:hypothetical protein [Halomonas denitrificans]|uniref:hypothetical protein n=1 Tax=Halomonas denitrificans TaxID=370769 RepID=UPI0013007696|nr:hypothetical protein [Halomonas denitrificans]
MPIVDRHPRLFRGIAGAPLTPFDAVYNTEKAVSYHGMCGTLTATISIFNLPKPSLIDDIIESDFRRIIPGNPAISAENGVAESRRKGGIA